MHKWALDCVGVAQHSTRHAIHMRTHTRTDRHTHTRAGTHILRLWCICFYLFLLAATMCGQQGDVFEGTWGTVGCATRMCMKLSNFEWHNECECASVCALFANKTIWIQCANCVGESQFEILFNQDYLYEYAYINQL